MVQEQKRKQRIKNIIYFLIFFLVEVIIALFIRDKFVRPYLGDVLVVVVLYFFVRIIIPTGIKLLPLYIFLFAAGVEVLQYFKFIHWMGWENNIFLRVLLGSVYDVKDIACYGAGCIFLVVGITVNCKILKK